MNTQVNRDQFLAGRKKGIGGSDVAAILGFSPYKSPYQLWLDKTGRSERKESQNESAHFGNLLEDVVAKEFSRRSGMKVQRVTQRLSLENIGEPGYRDWETDRKSTRLNSSHSAKSRMPSSA